MAGAISDAFPAGRWERDKQELILIVKKMEELHLYLMQLFFLILKTHSFF